ncbi:8-amino-7-oxononanoate synthase [Chthoniobacter flavus Ellin428]|uniref:8-amino-7-ketopelargonate synthase n=1 Tax=Chthoniobacter flavus Ellin428 TaxID=497964 RepID=B4D346_9BACT|nr:8-amino-7-oxononanoate synthase [Chthoniobacter flavus]EDY19157.1 8-amino-7-oxononanoate synthase [Chthoniobacter flavus Ellin428]TCO88004.1 8-amino-7-oxononanoate synthase [Chthoniobacter flavus]
MAQSIDSELAELRANALLRQLREVDSPQQPTLELAGRKLLNFSSNDYLGLATEPVLRNAAKQAIDEYGVGAGASRLICGTLSPHMRLEERLADFKRTEAALVFSSGYATAVGTIGALMHKDDVVILDKLCHASLIDGARMSGAHVRVYPHNHLGKLESHLQWAHENYPEARVLVVTESVFSMDGDWAVLPEIVDIKRRYGAMLMLDEAHAVGVIGLNGRGLADQLGVAGEVEIQMGTLSKALGVSGGYVCGSRRLIDLLINRARSFIFSTAPPPAMAAAALAAVEFMLTPAGENRRQVLRRNLAHFASEMPMLFTGDKKLQSAIIPIILGSSEKAIESSQMLAEKGFFVPAIRYPTVARDAARLRVTISAKHTPKQISALCEQLRGLLK